MNKLVLAIGVVLLATPLHVPAQGAPADASVGRRVGDWSTAGDRVGGSMEMVVDANGDGVLGKVRSKGSAGCSADWVKLAGVAQGKGYVARYDLGGQCES